MFNLIGSLRPMPSIETAGSIAYSKPAAAPSVETAGSIALFSTSSSTTSTSSSSSSSCSFSAVA